MMSRKDYIETARILNKYRGATDEVYFENIVDDFSFMFERDNPNFMSDKFVEACNK